MEREARSIVDQSNCMWYIRQLIIQWWENYELIKASIYAWDGVAASGWTKGNIFAPRYRFFLHPELGFSNVTPTSPNCSWPGPAPLAKGALQTASAEVALPFLRVYVLPKRCWGDLSYENKYAHWTAFRQMSNENVDGWVGFENSATKREQKQH